MKALMLQLSTVTIFLIPYIRLSTAFITSPVYVPSLPILRLKFFLRVFKN
jgi:hypothetical protein